MIPLYVCTIQETQLRGHGLEFGVVKFGLMVWDES